MRKTCSTCFKLKYLADFHRAKRGKFGRASVCKQCKRSYDNKYYRESAERRNSIARRNAQTRNLNREIMLSYKSSGCALCEESEPVALDFHHLDPETKETEIAVNTP